VEERPAGRRGNKAFARRDHVVPAKEDTSMTSLRLSASDAAQRRVLADEDPMFQAALEQLAVSYSIRTTLIWTLVVAPITLALLGIFLFVVLPAVRI
jgi:hypothetical protein